MVVALGPDVTVDGLVTLIQTQGTIPTSPTLLSATTIIGFLDNEMRGNVFPLVKSVKEEYWVVSVNYPILSTQSAFQIPYRATGATLRMVSMVDNNGNILKLTRYEPEDTQFPLIPYGSPYFPLGYYLQDNAVVLYPPVATNYTSYSLQMQYERRPSNLISRSSCGQVTSFNKIASTITLNFVPTAWTTSTTIDVLNNLPPFNTIADDVVITNIAGLTLTVSVPAAYSTTFWTNIAANYWVAPSMQTPIAQIPYDAFPYLAQLGLKRCMQALGDVQGIKDAEDTLKVIKGDLTSLLTPRVEGSPKVLAGRGGVFDYGRNMHGGF